jgi:hypothetical protein
MLTKFCTDILKSFGRSLTKFRVSALSRLYIYEYEIVTV